jgi:hypothetical protein
LAELISAQLCPALFCHSLTAVDNSLLKNPGDSSYFLTFIGSLFRAGHPFIPNMLSSTLFSPALLSVCSAHGVIVAVGASFRYFIFSNIETDYAFLGAR